MKKVKLTIIFILIVFSFTVASFSIQSDAFIGISGGIAKRGTNYYYINPSTGKTQTSSGFIKHEGHTYFIEKGGKLAVGKTLIINGGKYHFGGNGAVLRGLHKWGDSYYLANAGTGKIITSQRFVDWRGNKFYVYNGGKLAKGSYKVGNKWYKAWSNGKIVQGVYKWPNDKYYYSDPNTGEWIRKEGFVKYGGRTYCVSKEGNLYFNRPFVFNNIPYYANSSGGCKRLAVSAYGSSVLSVAQRQVGIMTGRKYWRWYFGTKFIDTDRTPWCGTFVAWCYKQGGRYGRISAAGNLGYVPCYTRFANRRGKWISKSRAKAGDIIVFGRNRHVGIVERIYKGYIYTIEGNSGPTAAYGSRKPGAVTRKIYRLNDSDIRGVIHP